MKKILYTFIGFAGIAVLISACSAGGENPGIEYAPNMYVSFAYEPFTQLAEKPNSVNPHGMNMRLPVANTIARGQLDFATYHIEKSNENYDVAGTWKNPLPSNAFNLAEGKRLFNINCTPCHGEDGAGKGTIVEDGKFPPVPSYAERLPTISEGKAFYSITHGRNLMGAYGTVLTPMQRWQVIHYIYDMTKGGSTAAAAPADSTAKSN
jgi:mono/diheme cytochrome c family protein